MDGIDNQLEQAKTNFPVLKSISDAVERWTGASTRSVALTPIIFPLVWCLRLEMVRCCILGYCIFRSVTSLEKGHQDRTRWLMYWLIFYSYELVESSPVGWTIFTLLPGAKSFLSYAKLALYTWCALPGTYNGCEFVYHFLKPVCFSCVECVDKNWGQLEAVTDRIQNVVQQNKGFLIGQACNAAATLTSTSDETTPTPSFNAPDLDRAFEAPDFDYPATADSRVPDFDPTFDPSSAGENVFRNEPLKPKKYEL